MPLLHLLHVKSLTPRMRPKKEEFHVASCSPVNKETMFVLSADTSESVTHALLKLKAKELFSSRICAPSLHKPQMPRKFGVALWKRSTSNDKGVLCSLPTCQTTFLKGIDNRNDLSKLRWILFFSKINKSRCFMCCR